MHEKFEEHKGIRNLYVNLGLPTRPTTKPPQCCVHALGMTSREIPDSAISASSSYNTDSLAPFVGRLSPFPDGNIFGGWASLYNDGDQFLQVDLGTERKITAVATQGSKISDQWVKSYSLSYSDDGAFWETVKDEQGYTQVEGCIDDI